ncbi:hypothetical protein COP2_030264 [Malus domestica]
MKNGLTTFYRWSAGASWPLVKRRRFNCWKKRRAAKDDNGGWGPELGFCRTARRLQFARKRTGVMTAG